MTKQIVFKVLIVLSFVLTSCKSGEVSVSQEESQLKTNSILPIEVQQLAKDTVPQTSSVAYSLKSNLTLPYKQTIDVKKITYETLDCKITGSDKFLCGENSLRYIPLPSFENIKVILVPMDCGDFNYRYYLLTIFGNEIVADYYVEGEWYEPGNEIYKEITRFDIDENYVITVSTNAVENGKTTLKEKAKLQILDDGILKKI